MIRWPVPFEVYLDTGVVVAAIFRGTPDAAACVAFCDDLATAGSAVYVSHVMRLDFARALRRLATIPGKLPADTRSVFALDQWSANPLIRRRWLSHGARELDTLLLKFAVLVEIPLSLPVWRTSLELMAAEALDASDAMHLAIAQSAGVRDLATTDRDFRRILSPRIHVIRDPHERDR